jgi:hypothetical protein
MILICIYIPVDIQLLRFLVIDPTMIGKHENMMRCQFRLFDLFTEPLLLGSLLSLHPFTVLCSSATTATVTITASGLG